MAACNTTHRESRASRPHHHHVAASLTNGADAVTRDAASRRWRIRDLMARKAAVALVSVLVFVLTFASAWVSGAASTIELASHMRSMASAGHRSRSADTAVDMDDETDGTAGTADNADDEADTVDDEPDTVDNADDAADCDSSVACSSHGSSQRDSVRRETSSERTAGSESAAMRMMETSAVSTLAKKKNARGREGIESE